MRTSCYERETSCRGPFKILLTKRFPNGYSVSVVGSLIFSLWISEPNIQRPNFSARRKVHWKLNSPWILSINFEWFFFQQIFPSTALMATIGSIRLSPTRAETLKSNLFDKMVIQWSSCFVAKKFAFCTLCSLKLVVWLWKVVSQCNSPPLLGLVARSDTRLIE